MALPSVSQITVPVANQNLTIQYKPENLIGERVFPILPLASPASKILKYSKANMFRLETGTLYRAEGGETKIFDWDLETQTVTPRQISAGESVPVEMIDIEQMPGQLPTNSIIDAVQHATARIDEFKEKLISDVIYGNTWLDGTNGGSAPSAGNGGWALDTSANSFIKDVYNAKYQILQSTGIRPNVLVMDTQTFYAQQFNPIVSDKIKYTQRSVTTAELLAELLQLDEVIIGSSVYTGAPENKHTKSPSTMTPIWSPSGHGNAFLFHREAPGLRVVTAGLQFRLPYRGSLRYVEGYYDFRKRSYVYTVTEAIDIAPVALDVGWSFSRTYS
jgi:hypothetical protein